MGVTYITSEQLQDVQRLRDSGASVKQIWEQLAQYNDSYAKGAVDVFRPNSNGWYMVRAIWDATGADMSKFDTVDSVQAVKKQNEWVGYEKSFNVCAFRAVDWLAIELLNSNCIKDSGDNNRKSK